MFIVGLQICNVVIYGGNICNGVISVDFVMLMLIYDVKLEIYFLCGVCFVLINGFYIGLGKVFFEYDEIFVVFYFLLQLKEYVGSVYFKYVMCDAMDILMIGCVAYC